MPLLRRDKDEDDWEDHELGDDGAIQDLGELSREEILALVPLAGPPDPGADQVTGDEE